MYFVYSSIEREVKFIFAPPSQLLEQETETREMESLRNIYIHAFLLVFQPSHAAINKIHINKIKSGQLRLFKQTVQSGQEPLGKLGCF